MARKRLNECKTRLMTHASRLRAVPVDQLRAFGAFMLWRQPLRWRGGPPNVRGAASLVAESVKFPGSGILRPMRRWVLEHGAKRPELSRFSATGNKTNDLMDKAANPQSAGRRTVEDATCTYCTCMCDDIALTVENNQIVDVKNACGLGRDWFLRPRPETQPACTIDGREATIEAGIERGAVADAGKISARLWADRNHQRSAARGDGHCRLAGRHARYRHQHRACAFSAGDSNGR